MIDDLIAWTWYIIRSFISVIKIKFRREIALTLFCGLFQIIWLKFLSLFKLIWHWEFRSKVWFLFLKLLLVFFYFWKRWYCLEWLLNIIKSWWRCIGKNLNFFILPMNIWYFWILSQKRSTSFFNREFSWILS